MMKQARLCAVWTMENWLGSSLNQIQGWTSVRESYSRASEQGPLAAPAWITHFQAACANVGFTTSNLGKWARNLATWQFASRQTRSQSFETHLTSASSKVYTQSWRSTNDNNNINAQT